MAERDQGIFNELYGYDNKVFSYQTRRYKKLLTTFKKLFKAKSVNLFSTPGRTELGGNHTDHNHGLVLAGAVNLDTIAAAQPVSESVVTISSEGYSSLFIISLDNLTPVTGEEKTTSALIRGIAYKLKDLGYHIGGFNAYITSDVFVGSGLSSSASIEILIVNIFNYFYNNGQIPHEIIARIAQYAENVYFGKPCGLMDQIACATGGIVKIDFRNSQNPQISRVNFEFDSVGFHLIVVNTGGNHADLTDEYSSIPLEMKSVASFFNKTVCRDLNLDEVFDNITSLRESVGDRAILRALHFFRENERVAGMVQALDSGNIDQFLRLINQSGDSSFKWLQNTYTSQNPSMQGISLALALTKEFLDSRRIPGACRVHGGGFAGTIQTVLPDDFVREYKNYMDSIFGKGAAQLLTIRNRGTCFWEI